MPLPLFRIKKVKIVTLADYLSKIRDQLNLDIKTVSLLTQIKQKYIENLEAGNYKDLPAEVYIKGFLKSLARLYNLEEQVLIEQFEKEQGFADKPAVPLQKEADKKRFSFTPRTILIGTTVLVALAAMFYIFVQVRSVLAKSRLLI